MRLVDTHHHFLPDFYAQVNGSVALMEKVGSTKAILSLTAPGALIAPTDEKRRALARKTNEFAAARRDEDPNSWGFFSALPCLLDTEGSLAEIQYALDVLKADGLTLFTRYGSGNQYLGHPAFKPIWEELNSRHAVVFVHPTHVILSHAGEYLPYLISRVSTVSRESPATVGMFGKSAAEVKEDFRSFYFDRGLSSSKAVLRMLLDLVPHDHILYGSDFPYVPFDVTVGFKQILDDFPLDQELREKIYYKNAEVLFAKRD
ncbi:hypothetical protein BJX65DRAFT_297359 [Aspergillus insuetus]